MYIVHSIQHCAVGHIKTSTCIRTPYICWIAQEHFLKLEKERKSRQESLSICLWESAREYYCRHGLKKIKAQDETNTSLLSYFNQSVLPATACLHPICFLLSPSSCLQRHTAVRPLAEPSSGGFTAPT